MTQEEFIRDAYNNGYKTGYEYAKQEQSSPETTNPNDSASSMTKREQLAMYAMNAILSGIPWTEIDLDTLKSVAYDSHRMANVQIKQLNKPNP